MQRRETQRTESALGKEIAEKRRLLYERHGGIMSPVDVAREMGYYPKPSSGDRWAQEHDVPAVRLGARKPANKKSSPKQDLSEEKFTGSR